MSQPRDVENLCDNIKEHTNHQQDLEGQGYISFFAWIFSFWMTIRVLM